MKHFFRGEAGDYIFQIYGLSHMTILLIISLFLYYFKLNMDDKNKMIRLKKISISILMIQQLALYSWYIFSGYFILAESLPFYNCRIAILSLIFGSIYNNTSLKKIGVYWGIPGAIIALLYPILDPFGFDHFSFHSFFIGHIALLFASLSSLQIEGYLSYYSPRSLKNMMVFSTGYHILIIQLNKIIGANYCYMNQSPIGLDFINKLSERLYQVLALISFDLLMLLFTLVIKSIFKKLDKDKAGDRGLQY